MSEQDNKMNINSSGGRLNAGAAAFVPGNYDSKPAATSTTKPTINNSSGGPKGGPNRSGSGYRNNNRNYNNGGMMQGGYYQQASYGMTPEQQMYIYQMQQLAAAQGCAYDPVTNMMYVIAPEYMVDPSQYGADYIAGTEQVVAEESTEETGPVTGETGDVNATAEGTTEEAEVKTEAETETKEEAPTAPVVAKYVPPTRSTTDTTTPTTTTPVVAVVDAVTDKLSGLTIEADGDNEEPVDIESTPTGEVRRYTKNLIVSLYSNENTVIPAELESYYKPADYTQGCIDGKPFCRAPLGSILALAEAGVAFGGRDSQGGRNNKSSHNLRGGNSSSNLERSGSNNNFGRRNRNDKDREPGELVEGDEGFVPYEGNADDIAPRERTSKKNKNATPAVYKSRFVLDASDPLAIVRKANGILNKLSITNFDKLSEEFLQMLVIDITTVDQLHKSVEALVTKAQMEENFCFIYADLCRKIIDQWEDLEPETGIFMNPPPTATTTTTAGTTTVDATTAGTTTASTGDSTEEQQTETTPTPTPTTTVVLTEEQRNNLRAMGKVFKDALLSRCQTEFEFDHISVLQEIRDNSEFSPEEKTEKEILLKKRITGHMRFIGELYMKDLITANIMKKHCLEVLLKSIVEEELVCLCKLFQTVGAKIEKYHLDKSRQKKYKDANMQDVVPRYFETIALIGETHPSSRVRFMMKDLVDMRLNDWTARREEEKMINLDKKNTPSAADFAPVSGDARSMAAPADEWLVVPSTGRTKKTGGFGSGAPSPVPGGMSRSGSNTNFSRSANASGNNLTGLDRRAPRGPSGSAGSSGVAGGLKKEKTGSRGDSRGPSRENSSRQARGSSRGASASPVPTKDDEGGATATTTTGAETATTEVLPYSTDLADIQKRVRSAMKEYYTNGLIEEPSLTFQELRPSPTLMPDIVKDMISQAVETSSEKSCTALCALLQALRALTLPGLPSTTTVLAVDDVKEAVFRFLNNFDDVLIDAPKAGTLGAVIVAQLCVQQALSLELFGCLPEDNEFAFSSKFAEFVVQVLAALSSLAGAERAEELYKQSQFDLLKVINAPPKETPEDVLRALAKKHNVTFLA